MVDRQMVGGLGVGVSRMEGSFWHRHRGLKWILGLLLALFVVLGVVVTVTLHRAEPMLRARIVAELERHFHARVELDSFHVSVASGLWAEGKGLRIWPPAEVHGVTVPAAAGHIEPLIQIAEFRFHAPLRYWPGKPIHISVVELKGLLVDIPPKSRFTHAPETQGSDGDTGKPKGSKALLQFEVGSIVCTGAHLTLETSKPGKLPTEFGISSLKLTDLTANGKMKYDAQLSIPRPAGTVLTAGSFGPWVTEDPGESAVTGEYKLEHADLGVFKGIAGILNSIGTYEGTLRDLTTDGVTDTPDFRLTSFGSPLELKTRFHAKVDGTDGDTWLEPVDATLGQSHFTVQGEVVRVLESEDEKSGTAPRLKGHDISLKVNVDRGRMEDFMRLTSKSGTPQLTGTLTTKTSLEIPPGKEPVHHRIRLKGSFVLDGAQFASAKIQSRIADLSLRGQGKPADAKNGSAGANVRSTMQSDFKMEGGVITLPNLKYTVPGADIELKGTYGVESGALNFDGTAKMQATVSAMVGGWKGLLLKPADRFFKKDGAGTEVPIHIDGTRQDPHFKIDFGRMKKTPAQRPGETQ
jgi:hypothetical protein